MKESVKVFTALVVLSLMAVAVNAGNLSPAVKDVAKTLEALGITITSPTENQKIGNKSVHIDYTKTGVGNLSYSLDGASQIATTARPIELTDLAESVHNVKIFDADTSTQLAEANFSVDVTAPAEVTNLSNAVTPNKITWTWTNPGDADFKNTRVTVVLNSTKEPLVGYNDIVLPKEKNSIEVLDLPHGTEYEITVQTEDNATTQ